jgi:hypothetical protein
MEISIISSCKKDESADLIRLDLEQYTFPPEGGKRSFKVQAAAGWTALSDSVEWLLTSKSESELILEAKPNSASDIRTAIFTLKSGVASKTLRIEQIANEAYPRYARIDHFSPAVISPSGNYIGGLIYNTFRDDYTPVVINILSGLQIEYSSQRLNYDANAYPVAIADNGTMIMNFDDYFYSYPLADNQPKAIAAPQGATSILVYAISADGSTMVGASFFTNPMQYRPTKWINGQPQIMPMPRDNCFGEALSNGALARGCSADGSVIYGSEWDDAGLLYWKDGEVKYVGAELWNKHNLLIDDWWGTSLRAYVDKAEMEHELNRISLNGRYIVFGYARYSSDDARQLIRRIYPGFIDLQSGQCTVLEQEDLADMLPTTASDQGIMFYSDKAMVEGFAYNSSDGASGRMVNVRDWIHDQYHVNLMSGHLIERVSSDAKTIFGNIRLRMNGQYTAYTVNWYLKVPDNH